MKRLLQLWLATLACLLPAHALAANYEVNLTRKGSNTYKVDGKDIIIQTRFCFVYAYSEAAILKTAPYGGEITFFDSREKCDVKAVLAAATPKPGRYVVNVRRDEDDWYEVSSGDSYIKTSACLSISIGEDAYLTISSPGFGRLRFEDGETCMVEGVYTKVRR